MQKYDVIVIGFGKAGKTLAVKMKQLGKSVAVIEQNDQMYGGTCINIGCIPTKTLIRVADEGGDFQEAMAERKAVTDRLRGKNYAMLDSAEVDVYHAKAQFVDNKTIEITAEDQSTKQLTGDVIVINTGAVSNILPIDGLTTTANVYDSTGIQQLDQLPAKLGVIGGGNIGLEFASLYATLGSEVTVFEAAPTLLGHEEPIVAELAKEYLNEKGITIYENAKVQAVSEQDNGVKLVTADGEFQFDAVLYATGRKPAVEGLNLEATDIELTERGAIKVDDYCQTSVPNVFAVGDVNGGLQFTYVSLDDFRIVFQYLTQGAGGYNLAKRGVVPTTTFIEPPLSRVGLTEAQAKEAGKNYATKELRVAGMPRAHVNGDLRGVFKVVVDQDTQLILGATLFSAESQEIINLIKMAMDHDIPYTYFQKQIFTHPTMAENLNDVFAI